MFTTKKIALVTVINDLVTDQRVNKSCKILEECGYHVILIGRKLPDSLPLPKWSFQSKRLRLLFTSGPFFYFFFNLRLFFLLLFKKADLLYANDLDTLLPNYLVAKIKGVNLIYDSHELFCEVPELAHAPVKKYIWSKLEKWLVPNIKTCITVNESIAAIFLERYHVHFHVIRNIPEASPEFNVKSKFELGLPENKKILILQGAGINMDRGAEELVEAMRDVQDAILCIIGSGDSWPVLVELVKKWKLEHAVFLINKLPKAELLHYTTHANLGISIDKNTNLNYYYSLPNKIFDYLQAGVPVLASRLPEIERILEKYNVGFFIESHDPKHIALKINESLKSPQLEVCRQNTQKVKTELNWEIEKKKLKTLILTQGNRPYQKSK